MLALQLMHIPQSLGILTPENKAAPRLNRDAKDFIANKRKGVISGAGDTSALR
jgi:hypothetical protein